MFIPSPNTHPSPLTTLASYLAMLKSYYGYRFAVVKGRITALPNSDYYIDRFDAASITRFIARYKRIRSATALESILPPCALGEIKRK